MKIGNWDIRANDRVTILDPRGNKRTGLAIGLLLFPTHAVLDMGGRYGTPAVANALNIVAVKRGNR